MPFTEMGKAGEEADLRCYLDIQVRRSGGREYVDCS